MFRIVLAWPVFSGIQYFLSLKSLPISFTGHTKYSYETKPYIESEGAMQSSKIVKL